MAAGSGRFLAKSREHLQRSAGLNLSHWTHSPSPIPDNTQQVKLGETCSASSTALHLDESGSRQTSRHSRWASQRFVWRTGKRSSRVGRLHCQDECQAGEPRDFPIILKGRDPWKPLMDFVLKMADEGALDPRRPPTTWSAAPCNNSSSGASPCRSAASCRETQVREGVSLVWPVFKESGPGDREEATSTRCLEPCQLTARRGARRTRGRGRRRRSCRLRFRSGRGGS